MFLFELALELGERSPLVVARAHEMGMTEVSATSQLTPDQVQALRAAYGRVPPPPPPGYPAQGPVASPAGPGSSGDSKPFAMVALAVVLLAVVGLFGYMLTHQETQSVAASDAEAGPGSDATTTTTVPCRAGGAVGAVGASSLRSVDGGDGDTKEDCGPSGGLTTTSTTLPADPLDLPKDKDDFCTSSRSAIAFEQRMVDVVQPGEIGPIRDVILQGRDQWHTDVETMIASAPPRLSVSLELYRHVYTDLLDPVQPDTSDENLARLFLYARTTDLTHASYEVTDAMSTNCK